MDDVKAPLEYPTFTIDGKTLVIRFDLYAQLLLSRQGVDLKKPPTPGTPEYLAHRLQLFAAAAAGNYPPAEAPTPDDWAKKIGLARWVEVDTCLNASLGKAAAELRTGIQVVPPPAESLAS